MKNIAPFLIIGGIALLGFGKSSKALGLRNNNPGNIKFNKANNWEGQTGKSGKFVKFSSPLYGIRAMAKLLQNYQKKGDKFLVDIIYRWAPPSENNTGNYINLIEKYTGLYGNQVITPTDYPNLIQGIIRVENGSQPYTNQTIQKAINMVN